MQNTLRERSGIEALKLIGESHRGFTSRNMGGKCKKSRNLGYENEKPRIRNLGSQKKADLGIWETYVPLLI